jgi:hypothetical protein
MADVAERELEIYLFGAAKGETIVLHLPDGSWGVVDCYASSLDRPETNPAYRLLRDHGVRELAFLCLTHPHDDHFSGMSRLVKDFKIHAFWSILPLDPQDFNLLKTYFKAEAELAKLPILKEKAAELTALFDLVEKSGCRLETVDAMKLLYPWPKDQRADFRIWGLAPSTDQVKVYRKTLLRQLKRGFYSPVPRIPHNMASAALRLEYGQTTVVLGGDVEEKGWEGVLEGHTSELLSAHFVKVSHHGSTNGFCKRLWATFSMGGKSVAALTPYRRFKLPDPRAITHIKSHIQELHSASIRHHVTSTVDYKLQAVAKHRARRAATVTNRQPGCCQIGLNRTGNCRVIHHGLAGQV